MSPALAADALPRLIAERALQPSGDPALEAAVVRLVAAAGESLRALLFFGSRRTRAAHADAWSAYDVIVVVDGYLSFYSRARAAGLVAKRPSWLALLSRVLPPTQVSLRFPDADVRVKASVIDERVLVRETSPRRRDHFCIGRLFQPTTLLFARDEAARRSALACLASAVRETWAWSRPWLPERIDADAYGRSALHTSMRFELRPEPGGRAEQLWSAQRALQAPVFEALLLELAAAGELMPAGEAGRAGWSARRQVGRLERLRLELYFRLSMARATLRWFKHMLSFEGWLDYIVHKASRHTGETIQLSERERRYPLVFLWGRVFRHLAATRRRGGARR
jgi:hypothetical protein